MEKALWFLSCAGAGAGDITMTRRRMKYNPSFLTEEELIDSFVVRHADLDHVVETITENCTSSNQHLLIIGPRGSGKTTMVHRIAAEIARTEELSARWFPLIFSEESYEVVTAGEFWLEALFHLGEQTGGEKWLRTHRELKNETDDQRLGERALIQLLDFADSIGKRLLIMVENLNMLLGDLASDDEAWKIRHTLLNEPRIMLLATATCRFEHIENTSQAMFEMFKMQELKPLDDDECNLVWEHITGHKLLGERIKPIRILTGGNPRLLTIIAKFSAHRSFHKLLDDLVNLIDDHTEYFKSHLDSLPATERKVYLALCSLWDASTAREIAQEARIDINRTSSLLSRLVNRGAVTIEPNSKKTKWFVVAERMYNIYYLMRRRGKPADRVKATVKFLTSMYDHESATKLITEEACGLPPELRTNHCLAFEAALAEVPDRKTIKKIIEATPKEFLESPDLSDTVKNFISAKTASTLKNKSMNQNNTLLKEANSLNSKGIEYGKAGKHQQAIEQFDTVICQHVSSPDDELAAVAAMSMLNKGITLGQLSCFEEEIVVYDELIVRFGGASKTLLREQVANALLNKGITLGELNRPEEAIAAYDEVLARFSDTPESAMREQVAKALLGKGITFGRLNRSEEAIVAYNELIARFNDLPESAMRERVAMALFNKGYRLGLLNRYSEEISLYDEVVTRFGDAPESAMRERVAKALHNKGYRLGLLNRCEEEITAYDELIARFGDAPESVVREVVAKALLNKGITLGKLNRPEEAIATYDETFARFRDTPESAMREQVAKALVNKGYQLGLLNRYEEEIAAYDMLLACFSDAPESAMRVQVAIALLNKGYRLGLIYRCEDEIAVYDELITRFGDAPENAVRERVAKALFNKGYRLGKLSRCKDEIVVYEELVTRFGDAPDSAVREQVAKALVNKGIVLVDLNRSEEAIVVYDVVITRYADISELQDVWLRALTNKADVHISQGEYEAAEAVLREALIRATGSTMPAIKLIALYLKMPGKSDDALLAATEIIEKHPEDAGLLNDIAWMFYQSNVSSVLPTAEEWAHKAVSLATDNNFFVHTYACILSALGKVQEALEYAKRYILDTATVEKTIDDAIQLFVELAAAGQAKEGLELLENAEAARHLEPLVIGLKMYLGEEVKTAPEIKEVAKDLVKMIEERKELRH
ncbi:MAG: tetratricopeptide repeat protein [Geobacter sp.]|nr:tetratricopeptide repeat protein [Geobacter sp.]